MANLPAELLCLIIAQIDDQSTLHNWFAATIHDPILHKACLKAQDAMETITIGQGDLIAGPRTSTWDPNKGSGLIQRLTKAFANPLDGEHLTPASNVKRLKLDFHFEFAETPNALVDYDDIKWTLKTLLPHLKNVEEVEVDGLFYEETLKQIIGLLGNSVKVLKLGKSVPKVRCAWAGEGDEEDDWEDDEGDEEDEDAVLEPRPFFDHYFDWTVLKPLKKHLKVLEIHQLQPGVGDSLAAAVERLRLLERLVVCATNIPEREGDNYGSSAMGIFTFHIFHWDDRYRGCRLPKTLKSLVLVDIHSLEIGTEAPPRPWEKPACPDLTGAYIDFIDVKATKRIMDWLQPRKLHRLALPGPTTLPLLHHRRLPTPGDPMSMLCIFPQTSSDWFRLHLVGLVKANKHRIEELTLTNIWGSQDSLKPKPPAIEWWRCLPILELVLGTEPLVNDDEESCFVPSQFYYNGDGEEDLDTEDELGWDEEDEESESDDKGNNHNGEGGEENETTSATGDKIRKDKKAQEHKTLDTLITNIYGFKPLLTILSGWGFRLERLKIEPIDFQVMLNTQAVPDPALKSVRILVLQPRSEACTDQCSEETDVLPIDFLDLAQRIAAQGGFPNLKIIVMRDHQFWIERIGNSPDGGGGVSIKLWTVADAQADPRQKHEIHKSLSPRDWAFIEEILDEAPSSHPNPQTVRHRNYMVMHRDDSNERGGGGGGASCRDSQKRFVRFEKEITSLNYERDGYIAKDIHAFP
ncbi:MAG: hypothetical protein MMC33_008899 [Icmadophila ericetorum]|nr:hypothetical protein [Icmadophila ericetorum]